MKVTKKLFIAALAVAGFTFAGCNMNQDDLNMIDFDAPGNKAEINYTNETGAIQRGWKTFNTNHKLATCVIELDTSKGNAGNMGFIWGLQDNDDDTCNFYVASINYGNEKNGNNLGYYISYYKGVGKKYLTGETSYPNFCDKDGEPINTTENANGAKETQIVPTSGIWTQFGAGYTNKAVFQLEWVKEKGYTISIAPNCDEDGNLINGTVAKSEVFNFSDSTLLSKDKAPDLGVGVYAMSNAGKTLTGNWSFPSKKLTSSVDTMAE